ncbi:anti-sigma factor antagonist [Rivularia sp. UHCC 0363]|uniref:anti-sigma factor antagonist n=1 Tax=Rivularia sp. UHCC 0363 TaxID=3110244 RepID=UPI002B1EC2E0|nr:anti-sigma factor antagonist [Rivularia sp. UHCC 0363]MEA5597352.1 anti-sigma factor antagonist [Rivularia sp. UHCC 0363]
MSFSATTEINGKAVIISIAGELDAASAPVFRQEIEQAAAANPEHLVLEMSELDYMASAGLRVLIFAKQKMGVNVDVYVVAAQEMVLETLEKTGFDQSVIIADRYDATVTA